MSSVRVVQDGENPAGEHTPLLQDSVGADISECIDQGKNDEHSSPRFFILVEIAIFCNVFLAGFDGTVTASTYASISSALMKSNLASWITTSYLLTSAAIQPLYGRFSDIFGRRICLLTAGALFGAGCLACSLSPDMIYLIIMRGVTGLGGGGLMTMTTIINSDLVPKKHRGMYQALQNVLHGAGAIAGATLGGFLSDMMGWRVCFLAQVPVAVTSFVLAYFFVNDTKHGKSSDQNQQSVLQKLDMAGASLLFVGLVLQLTGMSLGSELGWSHPAVTIALVTSTITLVLFVIHERRCKTTPILPLKLLAGRERVALLISNISLGITSYGMLFLMPLFFQAVLLDSASVAGIRLILPSLATPLGGLITGISMRHGIDLTLLTRAGLLLCLVGALLTLTLGTHNPRWRYSAFLIFGNLGQGIVYPSLLFGVIKASDEEDHAVATSLAYLTRSMGTVWGVAAVSTMMQSLLPQRLEAALREVPGAVEIVERLKHSTSALQGLNPDVRSIAVGVYYDLCHLGVYFLLSITIVAVAHSFLIPSRARST